MRRADQGLFSDPDAQYAHVIELRCHGKSLPWSPLLAIPATEKYIRDLNTGPGRNRLMAAPARRKNEDMDMYAQVLDDALKQGSKVADSVQFYIQFGSQETRDYCVRKGYLKSFTKTGAQVIEPSCGACINAGPGVSTRPDQIVISAQNRNFPGRSGPGQMYRRVLIRWLRARWRDTLWNISLVRRGVSLTPKHLVL